MDDIHEPHGAPDASERETADVSRKDLPEPAQKLLFENRLLLLGATDFLVAVFVKVTAGWSLSKTGAHNVELPVWILLVAGLIGVFLAIEHPMRRMISPLCDDRGAMLTSHGGRERCSYCSWLLC